MSAVTEPILIKLFSPNILFDLIFLYLELIWTQIFLSLKLLWVKKMLDPILLNQTFLGPNTFYTFNIFLDQNIFGQKIGLDSIFLAKIFFDIFLDQIFLTKTVPFTKS